MTGTTDRDYLKGHPVQSQPSLYIVSLNCPSDDFVLRAFTTYDAAKAYILANPPPTWAYANDYRHPDTDATRSATVYGRDAGSVNGYNLLTIADGVPIACEGVFWPDSPEDAVHWPHATE